jgi:hypothetical protein
LSPGAGGGGSGPRGHIDSLRIVADLARQPQESKTNGYDLYADSATSGSSDGLSPAPAGRTAAATLSELGWEGSSIHRNPFSRTQSDADAMASRRFRYQAERFLHGEVLCRDAVSAKTGGEIILEGVSARLAGRYRVEECRHRFDTLQGLRTHLLIHRSDWNP